MRALVYEGPRRLILEDLPRPQVAGGEVEIAVSAAGICGVDLKAFAGQSRRHTAPLILGHELVGRTADGRRVVADPVAGCGTCADCLRGRTNLCRDLRLLGMDPVAGCFAEFVAVPERQVVAIPEDLSDACAVLAEPLANIVHLFRLSARPTGLRVGIVGAGLMGSMALQLVLHLGARAVLVEDVDALRLASSRQNGAALVVNAANRGEAREFAGAGLDLVVDACGAEDARQEAFALCRPGGTVVLLGMAKPTSAIDFGTSIRRELRVAMSFGYTAEDFGRSVELLIAGVVDLRPWTEEMPLENGQLAFERMTDARADTLKMVLRVR